VAALSLVDWDIEPIADQMMACVVIGFLILNL
jgi:hypothetical protein